MNLKQAVSRLLGTSSDRKDTAATADAPGCPRETTLVGYLNSTLSSRSRGVLEQHLAYCDECRDLIATFARSSEKESYKGSETVPNDVINEQARRVLVMIHEDQFRRSQLEGKRPASAPRAALAGSWLKIAAAAVAVAAITGSVFWLAGPTNGHDQLMAELEQVVQRERRIEGRISGGIDWSRYSVTRGDLKPNGGGMADARLRRLLAELKYAEDSDASPPARLVLARVYLARAEAGDAARAFEILSELAERAGASSEFVAQVLNDAGVAQLEGGNYERAIRYFDEAIVKGPDLEEALFNRALANHRAGNRAHAIEDWKEFIERSSDPGWTDEARYYLRLLEDSGRL